MSWVALFVSNAVADWGCRGTTSGTCKDTGCAAAGGRCFETVVSGGRGVAKAWDCRKVVGGIPTDPLPPPKPRTRSEGRGKADPLEFPPSPFEFDLSSFLPGTFSYEKTIETDAADLNLTLLDFTSTLNFLETAVPEVREIEITTFEWEFAPFDLPGTNLENVNRYRLSRDVPADWLYGYMVLDSGFMLLTVPVEWLDTAGRVVALSNEYFELQITPESDTIVDVQITDISALRVVPEPATLLLFSISLLSLVTLSLRRRRSC
jgi:hypothetical protein